MTGSPPRLLLEQVAHTYEVDAFELLSPTALAGWLQEAAGRHAVELGVGVREFLDRGLTWVLLRQAVEVDRPVRLGEVAEIATWPSGVERVVALRDLEVRVEGQVVARALTGWLVVDVATRRPVRPGKVLPPHLLAPAGHVLEAPELGPMPEGEGRVVRLPVRYQDIDRNLHVTNAAFVGWAVEAVPEETWRGRRLAAYQVEFAAEVLAGDRVESRAIAAGPGGFDHSVSRLSDGRQVARLRTRWVEREPAP